MHLTSYQRLVVAIRHGVLVKRSGTMKWTADVHYLTTRPATGNEFVVSPHSRLLPLASFVRELPRRHGRKARGLYTRKDQKQWKLSAEQLPLGYAQGTGKKQKTGETT